MKANMKRTLMSLVVIVVIVPATMAQNNKSIVERLDSILGVKLPTEYVQKVKTFAQNEPSFKDVGNFFFTENFIRFQVRERWYISKPNQLLFVWDAVYYAIKHQHLYTSQDNNELRRAEHEEVKGKIEPLGNNYNTWLKEYKQFYSNSRRLQEELKNRSADETILDRLNKKLGVQLPAEYEQKVRQYFEKKNNFFNSFSFNSFHEIYIAEQMHADWGISKQNQLIFVWDAIYEQHSKKNIYTGEDGDDKRLKEFEKVMNRIEQCGKKYPTAFMTYLEQMSAEAKQRSAEAKQRSAEAVRGIMKKDSLGLQEMAKFYSLYLKNPGIVRKDEINKSKKLLNWVIPDCKEYNIDYRAILLKELGDKNKVDACLKFYGVE